MPTDSFGRGITIDTEEAAKAIIELIRHPERQKPIKRIDIDKEIREGERLLKKYWR